MDLAHLEEIFGTLNEAQIRYMVVGGLAVIAHGYVRYTNDLDLVIRLDEANVRRAMESLKGLGYRAKVPVDPVEFANPRTRAAWIRDRQMVVFQLISERMPRVPIDVFVKEPFDMEAELAACEWLALAPTLKVPVVSRKQLLAMKQEAGRPKDALDIEYLEKLEKYRDE